ncbi:MAG: transcriptional repressor [candidate division Zixibacteria bacterium]|nr:transcriptional repressor [candidate division Zixibacteria bacterium]
MKTELEYLNIYQKKHGLKRSRQRNRILEIFLSTDRHVSAEDLLEMVKKKYPDIGYSTVYRSLNLFHKAGIARLVEIGDGVARYENALKQKQHHHLICENCGRILEFTDPKVDEMIEKNARKKKFKVTRRRIDVFGLCDRCRAQK